MKRAAVAELKENLSKYLRRVKAGEKVVVTERGVPIAQLVPVVSRKAELPAHLSELEKAGLVIIGKTKIPKSFWKWKRPQDKQGRAVAAIIEERSRER